MNMCWSRDVDVKYSFVVQSDLLLTHARFSRLLSKLSMFEVIFHISFPTPGPYGGRERSVQGAGGET